MSIEVVLWLIDVLPVISRLFVVLSILFLISIIITWVACINEQTEQEEQIRNNIANNYKKIFGIPVLIMLFAFLMPSQETMYMMLGAHYIKNSTLPTKVELAIEKKIDSYLGESGEKK